MGACWAHNPEVDGSKPFSATIFSLFFFLPFFFLPFFPILFPFFILHFLNPLSITFSIFSTLPPLLPPPSFPPLSFIAFSPSFPHYHLLLSVLKHSFPPFPYSILLSSPPPTLDSLTSSFPSLPLLPHLPPLFFYIMCNPSTHSIL